jgi:hypothetical protein
MLLVPAIDHSIRVVICPYKISLSGIASDIVHDISSAKLLLF